jgi:hypothetical protein
MKKISLTLVLVLVLLFGVVGAASAITYGAEDGEGHPYVGLMVAFDEAGAPLWRCSGTLISPTLYLTAGHCTEAPAVRAEVWFEADIQNYMEELGYPLGGETSIGGTTYTHPQFDPAAFYLYDLGMVVLDEPVYKNTYGQLPQPNVLDALKPKRTQEKAMFTAVGYGLQESFPDAAAWKDVSNKIRMVAYPELLIINAPGMTGDYSMVLSNNPMTGGTCYGDSGGPNFIGESNVIGGVTSFGINPRCAGTGGVYRIDRTDDLNWIYAFMNGNLP